MTSRPIIVAALACATLVAACTSDPSDTSPAGSTVVDPSSAPSGAEPITEPVRLVSADGVVSVEVPAGSVRKGTDLGIDIVDPAEVSGLDGAVPVGSAYRFRPEGIRFIEPLVVTYRRPASETGLGDGMPLVYAVVAVDGVARRAPGQRTEVLDGDLHHLSSVDTFGTFVLLDGGVTFSLDPVAVFDLEPEETFDVTLTAGRSGSAVEPWPGYDFEVRWLASGAVSGRATGTEAIEDFGAGGSEADSTVVETYTCDVVGSGTYGVEIGVDVDSVFDDQPTRQFVGISAEAACGDVGR